MKSLNKFFTMIAAGAFLAACGGPTESTTSDAENADSTAVSSIEGTYTVDVEKSQINWEGTMLEVGGVSLYGHNGTIKLAKGEMRAEGGKINQGSLVVDMNTISPEDENYRDEDGGRKSDLVGHLSSDDFFNVGEFPYSNFEISQAADGQVEGLITIRGIQKPVTIEDATISENEDGSIHATGNFSIDRQEFNVRFAMPVQEKVLSDKIKLGFDIVAVKTAA